jgi:Ca-activated chloride channel family protein
MLAVDFLAPWRLWWLLAVVALAAGYVGAQFWRRKATVRFTQIDLLDRVAPERPGWRRHVVAGVQLLGLAAGVVAIARPITMTTERTQAEGRILLMFDVSLSMEATDVEPSRLEAAKLAARTFVDQVAPDVEVGLVSFSGEVSIEVDPTLDRNRLDDGIDGLQLSESTAIGDALATGTSLLVRLAGDSASDEDKAPGAIVLLSDGETTVGLPTETGAQRAADARIPVFTIAFGTDGGSITDPQTGEVIPVPVSPQPLAETAETTGGAAYTAATDAELTDAYEQIQTAIGATLGEEVQQTNELTWQWAAAALLLIALSMVGAMWWLRGMV